MWNRNRNTDNSGNCERLYGVPSQGLAEYIHETVHPVNPRSGYRRSGACSGEPWFCISLDAIPGLPAKPLHSCALISELRHETEGSLAKLLADQGRKSANRISSRHRSSHALKLTNDESRCHLYRTNELDDSVSLAWCWVCGDNGELQGMS